MVILMVILMVNDDFNGDLALSLKYLTQRLIVQGQLHNIFF